MTERFRARAPAKINLGLKIAARRADGYHELRTVFQTLALSDTVEIELRRGRGVELSLAGPEAAGVPAGAANLAYRAAELAAERLGVRRRVAIRLTKRIPAGAGLGGGSSDAAAVLRILRAAGRCAAAPGGQLRTLLELAGALGSDVAPFLIGGTVLGLGRGEEVYALPDLGGWHCVLAMPRQGPGAAVATAGAFAAWDRAAALTPPAASATIIEFCSLVHQVLPAFRPDGRNRAAEAASGRGQAAKVHAGIENDFQPGVFSLSADFPRIHRQLVKSQAAWVSLTGSGAAQFGLFADAATAASAAAGLAGRYRSWTTRFLGRRACHRGLRVRQPQGWGVVQWQDTCL